MKLKEGKLIKHRLQLHLVLINNCNVRMFSKRTPVINLIYSGQQQFSDIKFYTFSTSFNILKFN